MKKLLVASIGLALLATTSVVAAPGAPLSYVQVRYVGSSNIGWEAISDIMPSTLQNHGGAQLRVLTVEVGYGTSRVAKINGITLPSSANYQTIAFCGSNFLTPCSAGQTIVGYSRYWNLDGYQGGLFYYQTTSINSPLNTMSDTLSIL